MAADDVPPGAAESNESNLPYDYSTDTKDLARISHLVLEAFEKEYGPALPWAHPMPGMFQPQELERVGVIIHMMETAYDRLVEHVFLSVMHENMHTEMRADKLEDEERAEKKMPVYQKALNDMMEQMREQLPGYRKKVDLEHLTPEQKHDLELMQRRLGIDLTDPAPSGKTIYDAPPVDTDAYAAEQQRVLEAERERQAQECGFVYPDGVPCGTVKTDHPIQNSSSHEGYGHVWRPKSPSTSVQYTSDGHEVHPEDL